MYVRLPWWLRLSFRHTRPLLVMCAIEFPFTVACLALFGIADPDTYRTALWTQGAVLGWNSDPGNLIYNAANHLPVITPTPWNQFTTDWNVVISILSMFILLAKTVCYILHFLPPIFSALIHAGLVAVYAVSISQQLASDYSDPAHPSKVPWMFTHGCGPPVVSQLTGFCQQAQASLAVAALQTTLFLSFFIYSVIMAFPTKQQKEDAKDAEKRRDEERAEEKREKDEAKGWEYEMSRLPQTPASARFPHSPMTPRTMAFNTLDGSLNQGRPNRDLPLRHHIAMGNETFKSNPSNNES